MKIAHLLIYGILLSWTNVKALDYKGEININGDIRQVIFHISKYDLSWSLEQSFIRKFPVLNTERNSKENSLKGDLIIYGNYKLGEVELSPLKNPTTAQIKLSNGERLQTQLTKITHLQSKFIEKEVEFFSDSIKLSGTLFIPNNIDLNATGIVFGHGSGNLTREYNRYLAEDMAVAGIPSLIFDKRGTGKSQGNWITSSLNDLANDMISAAKYLKSEIGVNNIGAYGVSQAGWVISRASVKSSVITYAILNSGGGISPRMEEIYSYKNLLSNHGYKKEDIDDALKMVNSYFDYLSGHITRDEVIDIIHAFQDNDWYKLLNLERIVVSEKNRKNWAWVSLYDPQKDISLMQIPIMLLFGSKDLSQPAMESIKQWSDGLLSTGGANLTIRLYPNAGHALSIGGHSQALLPKHVSFEKDLISWVKMQVSDIGHNQ